MTELDRKRIVQWMSNIKLKFCLNPNEPIYNHRDILSTQWVKSFFKIQYFHLEKPIQIKQQQYTKRGATYSLQNKIKNEPQSIDALISQNMFPNNFHRKHGNKMNLFLFTNLQPTNDKKKFIRSITPIHENFFCIISHINARSGSKSLDTMMMYWNLCWYWRFISTKRFFFCFIKYELIPNFHRSAVFFLLLYKKTFLHAIVLI